MRTTNFHGKVVTNLQPATFFCLTFLLLLQKQCNLVLESSSHVLQDWHGIDYGWREGNGGILSGLDYIRKQAMGFALWIDDMVEVVCGGYSKYPAYKSLAFSQEGGR